MAITIQPLLENLLKLDTNVAKQKTNLQLAIGRVKIFGLAKVEVKNQALKELEVNINNLKTIKMPSCNKGPKMAAKQEKKDLMDVMPVDERAGAPKYGKKHGVGMYDKGVAMKGTFMSKHCNCR